MPRIQLWLPCFFRLRFPCIPSGVRSWWFYAGWSRAFHRTCWSLGTRQKQHILYSLVQKAKENIQFSSPPWSSKHLDSSHFPQLNTQPYLRRPQFKSCFSASEDRAIGPGFYFHLRRQVRRAEHGWLAASKLFRGLCWNSMRLWVSQPPFLLTIFRFNFELLKYCGLLFFLLIMCVAWPFRIL